MPELPEVEALARFLTVRCVGRVVARTEVPAFMCLKTTTYPLSALAGLTVERVERRGKFLGLDIGGLWLVMHLAHAGWLTWRDTQPAAPAKPGRGPLAFRLVLDDDSGFDLTEAGTRKSLAVYVVGELADVPGVAGLGPDPLGDDFTYGTLDALLDAAGAAQLKGVLRDQRVIAGIGNAYSDEILWAARLSPFAACTRLDPEQRGRLYAAIRGVLGGAVADLVGRDARELKPVKHAGYAVHARTGEPCPACGTPVAAVSFAESSLQYCPQCQTAGRTLADRRLSRLLK